jgi:hypothetical protein
MASSSSNSFSSSTASESSRETTPKFDSEATHEAYATLHWDAEEWDFRAWSKDDESLTDGEDLQFLLNGELEEEDDDDDESWDGYVSSSEDDDDESTEEDPTVGSFLCARSSDKDNDRDDGGDSDDGADSNDGSSSDDGAGDDGSDGGSGDSDVSASPPIKRHRFLGTYWWLCRCTKPIDRL